MQNLSGCLSNGLRKSASENIARNYPDFANDFEKTIVAENLGILRTAEEQMSLH